MIIRSRFNKNNLMPVFSVFFKSRFFGLSGSNKFFDALIVGIPFIGTLFLAFFLGILPTSGLFIIKYIEKDL